MGLFDGCLLASDVDGTFITPDSVPQRNIDAVKRFMAEGGKFTFATGRCADACFELYARIGFNAPAAIINGTVIYDYEKRSVVWSAGLCDSNKEILKRIALEPHDGIGFEVHSRDSVIDLSVTPEVYKHNKYENLNPLLLSPDEAIKYEWNKVLFTFEDRSQRAVLKQRLIDMGISEGQLVFTNAYLEDGVHDYLEVIPQNSDKGTGILKLAEYLGTEKGKIFGIGDYYNDIPLLKAVDVAAVTAGAPDDVSSLADYVSCDVTDGAVGQFVDYIEERMLTK